MSDGLVGISDRRCIFSAYDVSNNERYLHLHLFSTYNSNRNIYFNCYLLTLSEKILLIKRELIFSERNINFNYVEKLFSLKNISYGNGYKIYEDNRNVFIKRWLIENTERKIFYNKYLISQRQLYTSSFYTSYRYVVSKIWHLTERYCETSGTPLTTIGNNRFVLIGLKPTPKDERYVDFLFYHNKFSFVINPQSNELFNSTVSTDNTILFENKSVIDEVIDFNFVNVVDDIKYADLPVMVWDKDKMDYVDLRISMHGINRIPLYQYGNTNTYFISGFIVPIADFFFGTFIPINSNFENNEAYDDYIIGAERHGYLKFLLFNKEYNWKDKIWYYQLEYNKIPFTLYIYPEYFDNNFMVKFIYTQSNRDNKIYSTILNFFVNI